MLRHSHCCDGQVNGIAHYHSERTVSVDATTNVDGLLGRGAGAPSAQQHEIESIVSTIGTMCSRYSNHLERSIERRRQIVIETGK